MCYRKFSHFCQCYTVLSTLTDLLGTTVKVVHRWKPLYAISSTNFALEYLDFANIEILQSSKQKDAQFACGEIWCQCWHSLKVIHKKKKKVCRWSTGVTHTKFVIPWAYVLHLQIKTEWDKIKLAFSYLPEDESMFQYYF